MITDIVTSIIQVLLTPFMRWGLFITVLILNFVAYFQDPMRMSNSICYFIECRNFAFVISIITFTLDILTFLGLYLPIKEYSNLPDYWYIPLIVLGYAIIAQITIDTKIHIETDKSQFEPPPNNLWPKHRRIILYTAILIINILIFIQFFLDSNDKYQGNKYQGNKVIDFVLLNRFGTFTKNKLSFLMGWFGVLGVLFDYIALRYQQTYEACMYNQSNTWNF